MSNTSAIPLSSVVSSLEEELQPPIRFKEGDIIVWIEDNKRRGGLLYTVGDYYLILTPNSNRGEVGYWRCAIEEFHKDTYAAQCVFNVNNYHYNKVLRLLRNNNTQSNVTQATITFISKVIQLRENGWESSWFKRLLKKWKLVTS